MSNNEHPITPPGRPGAVARWGNTTPQPVPHADGEVTRLVGAIEAEAREEKDSGHLHWLTAEELTRAATLLQQQAPQPVPVSERLPGPEDCDAEGRCWFSPWHQQGYAPNWRLIEPYLRHFSDAWWLPAHALPTPGDNQQ